MNSITLQALPHLLASIPSCSPAAARDRAACTALAHTGLLVQELCGLVVAQVAFDGLGRVIRPRLRVPSHLGGCSIAREIELNQQASSAFQALLNYSIDRGYSIAPAAPLLASRSGHFIKGKRYQQLLQRYSMLSA